MKHKLLALLIAGAWFVIIASTEPVRADSSEYTLAADGYWYREGVRYTRRKEYLPYDGYGQRQYYYKYAVVPIVPAYRPGWKTIHSATLAAIAKAEEGNKALAIDEAAYLQSAEIIRKALGSSYNAGFFSNGYFPQGSTAYAQTPQYNTVNAVANAQAYATPIDLNVALQGVARLADRSLSGGQELSKMYGDITMNVADNAARIALSRNPTATATSRGGAVRATASVGTATPTGTNPATIYQAGPTVAGADPATNGYTGTDLRLARGQSMVNAGCLECHSAKVKKGNLDLSNIAAISDEMWREVVRRTHSASDDKRHMPPAGSSQPNEDQLRDIRGAR